MILTNKQLAPHDVTAKDGSFRSATLQKGDTFSHKLDAPGTVDYYCTLHSGMTGRFVVTSPPSP